MSRATLPKAADEPGSALRRVSVWSQHHHWAALAIWLVLLVGVSLSARALGPAYRNDISLPGTESQQVLDALHAHDPQAAGDTVQVVFHDAAGLDRAGSRDRVAAAVADVRAQAHVQGVTEPLAGPQSVSPDGTTAYATVQLDDQNVNIPSAAITAIITAAQQHRGDGLAVELGGDAVRSAEGGGGGPAEGLGMLLALVILLLMFGSVLAATLPLITAVFAVGTSVGMIALLSHWLTVPSYASSLMILVGLGVGIDYALLVFSRFRTELLAGAPRDVAVRTALDTAGRSVLVAGLTVMVALGGLLALGLASLQGVALSVALTVLVTMVASLTLLPSLLSLFGRRIEKAVHKRQDRAHRHTGSRWRAWAHWVCRRRWPAIIAGAALLVALSVPVLGMRLGIADAGTDAPGSTSRAAYDLIAQGFGPGVNGPLVVLQQGSSGLGEQAAQALSATAGVAMASPAQELADRSGALLFVLPTTAPQDAATADLVQRLRADVLPGLHAATGNTYLVGGTPAAVADFAAAVSERLPYFVGAVIGLSFVLLMLVFGSVAIPVKAAVLNVLSIGASLGVITLVFQHGWFGVQPGPIEAFVPVMIFAIVFGLSMDYEVFLIARMHEEWNHRRDAQGAIVEGVGSTGGVITAAASIMVAVFASFLLSSDRMLQQFGLGLAAAVFLDALVIRCLLVPTLMSLLGARAWWLPVWLRRALPSVTLEPASQETP